MRRPKYTRMTMSILLGLILHLSTQTAQAGEFSEPQQTAIADVESRSEELKQVNQTIWNLAEIGLQEHESSALLQKKLKAAGFDITAGVSNMPTAFVASYGSGKPIIGILAEYDALPGMSQQTVPYRSPAKEDAAGHACGHSGLGTGALGAAVAVKTAMEKHGLPGTIRLYGTPAEETVIGKVYMLLDGQFDDLDVCLHWHPSTQNQPWAGSSKALVSVKFTFKGTAAHASVSPESGRSALDAVELLNIGVNFMREHVKEDARLHYVVTNGGGQPNVVPAVASVWYYVRADSHTDVEYYFDWINDIAKGAATMTRTELSVQVDTDCHELIPNIPLSELLYQRLVDVGAPSFTEEERSFARRIQQPLIEEFGTQFPLAIDERIKTVGESNEPSGGSTDVGDISWYVPTSGIRTSCMAAKSPGHSWQNVACIGSSIGEKGTLYAAKVLAVAAIDLLEKPELVSAARKDWEQRMSDRKYTSLIPKGQKAPATIR